MAKCKFFSYNVKGNTSPVFYSDLNLTLKKLDIDVLVLQECFVDSSILNWKEYQEITDFQNGYGQRWVRVFYNRNKDIDYLNPSAYGDTNKFRFVKIIKNKIAFNLLAVHMYSAAGVSSEQQDFNNKQLIKYVKEYETLVESNDSIVIGDLNYKPYENALIHPDYLNTINNRNLIRLYSKRSIGFAQDYFYNPMWNIMGDHDYLTGQEKVNGTYYWFPDDIMKFPWNLIDGVLLRPSLMYKLNIGSLKIVTELNNKSLLKKIVLVKTDNLLEDGFSDHLPVTFMIKF